MTKKEKDQKREKQEVDTTSKDVVADQDDDSAVGETLGESLEMTQEKIKEEKKEIINDLLSLLRDKPEKDQMDITGFIEDALTEKLLNADPKDLFGKDEMNSPGGAVGPIADKNFFRIAHAYLPGGAMPTRAALSTMLSRVMENGSPNKVKEEILLDAKEGVYCSTIDLEKLEEAFGTK